MTFMQQRGVSGFQAVRDTIDILNGMGSRTIAGKELGNFDDAIKKASEAGKLGALLKDSLAHSARPRSTALAAAVLASRNFIRWHSVGVIAGPMSETIRGSPKESVGGP